MTEYFDSKKPNLKKIGLIFDYYIANKFAGEELPQLSADLLQAMRNIKTNLILNYQFGDESVEKSSVTLMFREIIDILKQKFSTNKKPSSNNNSKI